LTDITRRKPLSFEEYWLASKAWERKGLTLGTARALVNAGFFTIDDLQTAHDLELSTIPRVGPKSLGILYKLIGREIPEVAARCRKALSTVTQMTPHLRKSASDISSTRRAISAKNGLERSVRRQDH
jgi:hypothetical protein